MYKIIIGEKMYKFPVRLKELMNETNLSQNQLSKLTSIPQPTIARWLNDICKPSIDCLIVLSAFFKCSIDYLVGVVD